MKLLIKILRDQHTWLLKQKQKLVTCITLKVTYNLLFFIWSVKNDRAFTRCPHCDARQCNNTSARARGLYTSASETGIPARATTWSRDSTRPVCAWADRAGAVRNVIRRLYKLKKKMAVYWVDRFRHFTGTFMLIKCFWADSWKFCRIYLLRWTLHFWS